jgi:site-specific recombinase XerD
MEEYRARGVTDDTVSHVTRELDRWGRWLKSRRPRPRLEDVNADLIVRYIQGRTAFRSKGTVCTTMWVLRAMGEFLVREGVWTNNPLRWLRGPKLRANHRIPRRISASGMKRLFQGAATCRLTYSRRLWMTVIALLYGTGIRRGELTRLDLGDWRSAEGLLLVDGQKTGRQRQLPVPPITWRCLETYLPQRHNRLEQLGRLDQPALFVNRFGERVSGASVSRGVHAIADRCGVERVTLHQFRHTCASDLLEEGARLPEVQQMLGHQTIATTVRYLHIADPQRHAAVRLHPINAMLSVGGTP